MMKDLDLRGGFTEEKETSPEAERLEFIIRVDMPDEVWSPLGGNSAIFFSSVKPLITITALFWRDLLI